MHVMLKGCPARNVSSLAIISIGSKEGPAESIYQQHNLLHHVWQPDYRDLIYRRVVVIHQHTHTNTQRVQTCM